MKRFMAVYTGSKTSPQYVEWEALDEPSRNVRAGEAMAAWHGWQSANAAAIVDGGGPLGKTKRVTPGGIEDISNAMGGFVILNATSHEEAARLFLNHPHFTLFPGDGVEIMEILPIPGM